MVLIWCSYFNRLQFPHKKHASAGMGDYNVKMQFDTADKVVHCKMNTERRERGYE